MVLKIKKKRPKLKLNKSKVGLGEDKISNLPDALIHHILSFLPTKCCMSTCILSKRWKHVVNSIPILDFRNWRTTKVTMDQKELETKWFMNFVDTVLLLHENQKLNIQKFYLDLDGVFDEARVNRWINTVMNRKVEEFGLSIKRSSDFSTFHPSILICDSLTILDLKFEYMADGDKLTITNTVSFPKLKILRLMSIHFVTGNLTRLISNFPILEVLNLTHCKISKGLCIEKPTLKHLSITGCLLSESAVKISAPNLLTIRYTGYPPEDFVLNSFPSVVEADVGFDMYEKYKYPTKDVGVFVKLLEKLSSAKLLKIYANSFQILREADILLTDFPSFGNLIHLEIDTRYSYTSFGINTISTVRTFFKFLQLSPNLESITFPQNILFPDKKDNYWPVNLPCWPRQLKSIKFREVEGEPAELNAISFFLKYGGFLETVTIVASQKLSEDHKKQLTLTKLLLMFQRPRNCVVKFLTNSEDN